MTNILLLSRNQVYGTTDGQLIMPFSMFRDQLLGRDIRVTNVPTQSPEDRTNAIRSAFESTTPPDILITIPHWSEPADELSSWFERTRQETSPAKHMLLDFYDQTSSPHFGVLPYIDLYIKSKALRDRSLYQQDYQGGFIYADFVAQQWGFDLEDWHFGSKPDPSHAHKIVAGWNFGLTSRYHKMIRASKRFPIPWKHRPIGLHFRVGTINRTDKDMEWYQYSRNKAAEFADPLRESIKFSGNERVSPKRYYAELFMSRFVYSPFGWGEVCYRDFEAVAAGATLIKPDMSHVETFPNIYRANETYLPVSWDMQDLVERSRELFDDPDRAIAMRKAARDTLDQAFRGTRFVEIIEECIRRVMR